MKLLTLLRETSDRIIVYHGSRHDFDSFDLSKIGNETENLKGGWGIYLTTDKDVAGQYSTGTGTIKSYTLPNNSRRYFNLDDNVSGTEEIYDKLDSLDLISDEDLEEFKDEFVDDEYSYDTTNMQLYDWLSYVLGSSKNASMFLYDEIGFIGNTYSDKTNPDAQNYVLFDTRFIKSHLG